MAIGKTKKKRMTPADIICIRYHMRRQGIATYDNKSIARTIIGVGMITVGIVTIPIPCTTIPLCMGGCVLVGYDLRTLIQRIKYEVHRLKVGCLI